GAGLAAAKHALAFEALDFRARVAEVSQDLGVVLAEPRSHRADSGWGYAEAGGGSGLADPAELRGVVLLEDAAGAYLGVLEEFEAGSDGSRGDIVGEQAREDFIALPLLQFGGHYFAPCDGIDGAQARGLEAGVVDQILTIERAAHPGPFLVGERARGYVAILGGEDQVRTDFPVGGIAFVTDIGKGRHRLGPQVRDHRIEHRDPHVLSFAGAQLVKEGGGDGLRGGEGGGVVGDYRPDHPGAAGFPIALDVGKSGQGLDHGIVGALARIRSVFPESAYRNVDDIGANRADIILAEPEALGSAGSEVMDEDVGGLDELFQDRAPVGRFQVDGNGALVAIAGEEGGVHSCAASREPPHKIAVGAFDLDDVGALVGEHHRRHRPGHHRAEVENSHACEGTLVWNVGIHGKLLWVEAGCENGIRVRGYFT